MTNTSQVYCPHTAIDAAPGGLGDWLADIITGTPVNASQKKQEDDVQEDGIQENGTITPNADKKGKTGEQGDPFREPKRPVYMLQHHPSQADVKTPDLKQ